MDAPRTSQAVQPLNYEPRQHRRRGRFLAGVIVGLAVGVGLAVMLPGPILEIRMAIRWHVLGGKEQARRNTAMSQILTLRSQLELYKVQHGDELPNLPQSWDPLVKVSAYQGGQYGPYLTNPFANPFNGRSNIIDGDPAKPTRVPCGFIYDYRDGKGTGGLAITKKDGITPAPF